MMREIYLDNNATTQVLPDACVAMMEVMGAGFGNPSSAHRSGEKTRRALFAARNSVSKLFGCLPENILFGSGTTELNNWILTELCGKSGADLITSEVEHSSVLRVAGQLAAKGVEVTYLPVDRQGLIDLDELKDSIKPRTVLVSIQWANGETGVIQDIDS
ncbi:MAG: aminotransferase class V-fold PLP-dependent enzyme, partial [Planctomycetia bacterium]|nr:aminotransferase class V-fold PLP-dependent enzyme [Planctomycetia bacterium]